MLGLPTPVVIVGAVILLLLGVFFFWWLPKKLHERRENARMAQARQDEDDATLKREREAVKEIIADLSNELRLRNLGVAAQFLNKPDEESPSQYEELLQRAEQCELPEEDIERLKKAHDRAVTMVDFAELTRLFDQHLAWVNSPIECLNAYVQFVDRLETAVEPAIKKLEKTREYSFGPEAINSTLQAYVNRVYQALLPANTEEGVLALLDFCDQWKDMVQRPPNWAELVVFYVDEPSLALLRVKPIKEPMKLLRAADEAESTGNPILAAQVLAQCSEHTQYLTILGDLPRHLLRIVREFRKAPPA